MEPSPRLHMRGYGTPSYSTNWDILKKLHLEVLLPARKNQTNTEKRYADFFLKKVNVTTIYKNPLSLKKEEKKRKTKNPEKPRKLKNEKIKKSQTSRI